MSDTRSNPQERIAEAVGDLGEQAAILVRQELEAAKQEMTDRLKEWVPAAGLAGFAATASLFASAAVYRLLTRVFDKVFGPVLGPLMTVIGFGTAAGLAAARALQIVRRAPNPVPAETVQATEEAAKNALDAQPATNSPARRSPAGPEAR